MKLIRYVSGYYDVFLSLVFYVKTCLDLRVVDFLKGEVVGSVMKKSYSVCFFCFFGVIFIMFVLFFVF